MLQLNTIEEKRVSKKKKENDSDLSSISDNRGHSSSSSSSSSSNNRRRGRGSGAGTEREPREAEPWSAVPNTQLRVVSPSWINDLRREERKHGHFQEALLHAALLPSVSRTPCRPTYSTPGCASCSRCLCRRPWRCCRATTRSCAGNTWSPSYRPVPPPGRDALYINARPWAHGAPAPAQACVDCTTAVTRTRLNCCWRACTTRRSGSTHSKNGCSGRKRGSRRWTNWRTSCWAASTHSPTFTRTTLGHQALRAACCRS